MNTGAAPLIAVHLLAGMLAVAVGFQVWQRRDKPGGTALSIALGACVWWSFGRALGLAVEPVNLKLGVAIAWSLGPLTMAFWVLIFAIQYSGLDRHRLWRVVVRLAQVLPLFWWMAVWTNPGHTFWSEIYADPSASFALLGLGYEAGFWALLTSVDLAMATTFVILLSVVVLNRGLYRRQAALLVVGVLIPLVVAGGYGVRNGPLRSLELSAPALTLCLALMGWAVFGQRLLDIVPVAHQLVIDGIRDAVAVFDASDRVTFLNRAAITLAEPGAWQGQPVASLFPGLDTSVTDLTWRQRRFELTTSPLTDRLGRSYGRVMLLRDVSASKVLADASADLIAATSQDEILDRARAAMADVLPDTHPTVSVLAADGTAPNSDSIVETRLRADRDALVLWRAGTGLAVEADRLWTDERRPIVEALLGLVAMRAEVNREVVLRQREIQARADDLAALNQLKDSLLDRVAHELRTPLSAIRAYSEMLLTYDDPDVRTEFTQIINAESERLTRLVNSVLDLTKLESGTFVWNLTSVNVGALLLDAARIYRPLVEQAGINFGVSCAPEIPDAWGDRDRLQEVLANLLHNALKFTLDGEIRLEAVAAGEVVHISVSDSGIGILERDRQRIFEKFEQAGQARPGSSPGTGLGLAICRELIRHQGGDIWVGERPGGGSVFTFSLPVAGRVPATVSGTP